MLVKNELHDITLYKNIIDTAFCEAIIDRFKDGYALNEVIEGHVSTEGVDNYKSDDFLVSKDIHLIKHQQWDTYNTILHKDYIVPCMMDYISNYRYILPELSELDPKSCILSVYEKGVGHFGPHQDSIGGLNPQRSLSIICYFNDVNEGGQTYFFNQNHYVRPREGNIIIFPSNFVYAHEGQPPISNDKYISVSFASIDIGNKLKLAHLHGG